MTNKSIAAIVAGLVVIAGVVFYLIPSAKVGGTVENFPTQWYNGLFAGHTKQLSIDANGKLVTSGGITNTGTATIGASGTGLTQVLKGTCSLIGAPTIAATSTAAMDCAATGAVAGDTVFFTLATTTPSTNLGWRVIGANASSTSGFLTFIVQNLTGASAIPPVTVTSSVQFLDLR